MQNDPSLTTLVRLLDQSGLTATLRSSGPFTLIAPNDAAFTQVDPAKLAAITQDPELLKAVLRYHLVPKRISTQDVATGTVTTMEGSPLTLKASSGLPTINDLTVIKGARATNGTVLVVGTVLLPPDLKVPAPG